MTPKTGYERPKGSPKEGPKGFYQRLKENVMEKIIGAVVNSYINSKVPIVNAGVFGDDNSQGTIQNPNLENAKVLNVGVFRDTPSKVDFTTYDNKIFQEFFNDHKDGVLYCTEDTDGLLISKGGKIPNTEGLSSIKSYQEFLDLRKPESFALIHKDGKFYIRETPAIKQPIPQQRKQPRGIAISI